MARAGPHRHREKIKHLNNQNVPTDANGFRKLAGLFLFPFQSDIQGRFFSPFVQHYNSIHYIGNHVVLALVSA